MRLKKIVHLFSILSLALLFAFCSSSQNYYLTPDFENEKIESSLLVIPVERSLFNGFQQHTFSTLSGNDKALFESNLSPLLSKFSNTTVSVINSEDSLDEENFEIDSLETSESKFGVIIPKKGLQIGNNTETSRFVLLLDQFYFRKYEEMIGGSSYAGHEAQSVRRTLVFETKYVYWDNEEREPVGWGVANADMNYTDEPSNSDYLNLMSETFEDVIDRGPLQINN